MSDDNDYGFSGLGKRLDNIQPIEEANTQKNNRVEQPLKEIETNQAHNNADVSSTQPAYTQPPVTEPTNNAPKVFFAIIAVCVLFAIFSGSNNKSSNNTEYNYSNSNTSTPAPNNSIVEQLPPVGSGNILSKNEIRYCLSEKIRITKVQSIINYYSESEVQNMNNMVNDYNNRCAHFRYKRGLLESVRSEVNSNSYSLEMSANNTVNSWRTAYNTNKQQQTNNIISQTPQVNNNYVPSNSFTYTPENNHKKRSSRRVYSDDTTQYSDRSNQNQSHPNTVKQSLLPPPEEKTVSYSSLSPNQRANIDMDCFESKVKGEFFFNECREHRAARYARK